MPKTAGTSLSGFLEGLYSPAEYWHGAEWSLRRVLATSASERLACRVLQGHFGGGLSAAWAGPLRSLTLLRNPLIRALSHYGHVLRDPAHPLHATALELGSFGAYLRDPRTQPTVANFQLRSLGRRADANRQLAYARNHPQDPYALEHWFEAGLQDDDDQQLLEVATATLDGMCVVGLTERFDDSLRLACAEFGWPLPEAAAVRKVSDGAQLSDLSSTDLKRLRSLNEGDLELYERARVRFERDWGRSRFVHPRLHAFVSFAQNAEDVVLHRALGSVGVGFYVDVGANDPEGDSVTKAFYDRGWHGINIEPVQEYADALRRGRPRDITLQEGSGDAPGSLTLFHVIGTGLSTMKPGIAERHRAQGFEVEPREAAVRRLDSVIDEAGQPTIHFLKIDVEGFETEVIRGLDLRRTRPWVILVEATEPNSQIPSHAPWEPLLLNADYDFVLFDGLNRFYVARERPEVAKALASPANSTDNFVRAADWKATRELQWLRWQGNRNAESVERLRSELHLARAALAEEARSSRLKIDELTRRANLGAVEAARSGIGAATGQDVPDPAEWTSSAGPHAESLADVLKNARSLLGAVRRRAAEAQARIKSLEQALVTAAKARRGATAAVADRDGRIDGAEVPGLHKRAQQWNRDGLALQDAIDTLTRQLASMEAHGALQRADSSD